MILGQAEDLELEYKSNNLAKFKEYKNKFLVNLDLENTYYY
jgi:hypothetical protein